MKYTIKKYNVAVILSLIILLFGCNKQDEFLDGKPNQALAVPTTLNELSLMLNNEFVFNAYSQPLLGTILSDEINVSTNDFINRGSPLAQNAYTFQPDVYDGSMYYNDWNLPYKQVFICNVVLEALAKMQNNGGNLTLYNEIKGTALFFRAFAFYNLVQTYTLPYDPATADSDLGIPLRLSSVLTEKVERSSVSQSYQQITSDLTATVDLLPIKSVSSLKPSKAATYAMLSRVYLAMGNFTAALSYSEKCLEIQNRLTDYNTIVPAKYSLSVDDLEEVIYTATMLGYSMISARSLDSTIPQSYHINDLRKNLFFRPMSDGTLAFRGSYDRKGDQFCGLATDEIYLNRAECYARAGNTQAAIKDLNLLLGKRFKTGTFIPLTSTNADDALALILAERKKELVLRGLRWTDLRRLNREERFKKTVVHIVNGKTYQLPPNSLLYAISIPDQEIKLTGIQQNRR